MRRILSGIVCLSLFAGPPGTAADDDVEQTKAKLQAVRKQLDELRQQEQDLLKQLERAALEAAKKASYIKAEVKGILKHEGVYFPGRLGLDGPIVKSWTITVEDTKWVLDFGDNKAFLEMATANEGKLVVVTGRVGTRVFPTTSMWRTSFGTTPAPPPPTVLSAETFKAAAK